MRKTTILLLLICVLASCVHVEEKETGIVEALVPVYLEKGYKNDIKVEDERLTTQAGKIYAYRNYIFQNEVHQGIHIIDNKDRHQPTKIAFLSIPFSTEIAIKDNFLYSNSFSDLVVFDISNPAKPRLVKRVEDVFPMQNQQYPPDFNVYFECPDPAKGIVVKWEKKIIPVPNCRR